MVEARKVPKTAHRVGRSQGSPPSSPAAGRRQPVPGDLGAHRPDRGGTCIARRRELRRPARVARRRRGSDRRRQDVPGPCAHGRIGGRDRGSLRLDGREIATSGRARPHRVRSSGRCALRPARIGAHPALLGFASGAVIGERPSGRCASTPPSGSWVCSSTRMCRSARLSGGQRKRANIAAELVGEPDVLVLDEPTSGLDPGYEKSVMTTLRQLADAGRTVITVTHSVQAIEHCDRVLYLAAGGRWRTTSLLRRVGILRWPGRCRCVPRTRHGIRPGWKERFRAHPAYARYVTPVLEAATRVTEGRADPVVRVGPRWTAQVAILVRRQIALLRSDRRHLALVLLQGPLLGLLVRLVLTDGSLRVVPGSASWLRRGRPPRCSWRSARPGWGVQLGAGIVKERRIVRSEVERGSLPAPTWPPSVSSSAPSPWCRRLSLAAVAFLGQSPPSHGAFGPARLELLVVTALVGLAAAALGVVPVGGRRARPTRRWPCSR